MGTMQEQKSILDGQLNNISQMLVASGKRFVFHPE